MFFHADLPTDNARVDASVYFWSWKVFMIELQQICRRMRQK